MSEIARNHSKIYVDNPKDRSKPTCLIHVPGHSSYECTILEDLDSEYVKSRPTKYPRHNPANGNKFNKQKQNNAILNHAVDEIFLQGNNKVSDEEEANENIESDFDEKDIYQVDNTNLDDKKENIE